MVISVVIATILTPVLSAVLAMILSHVASWGLMSETVPAIVVIADGQTHPPINVDTLPIVEAGHPIRFASNPHVAWAEIKTGIAHISDKFEAVPDIIIRDFHDYRGRWGRWYRSNDHSWRGSYDLRPADHYPTGLHDTSRH